MSSDKRQDLIPNTAQFPNYYFDTLMRYLSSDEWKLLSAAVRNILGWAEHRATLRDCISYSQFVELTGLSRPMVSAGLAALAQFNVLQPVGQPTHSGQQYELNLGQLGTIDEEGLATRHAAHKAAGRKRTEAARSGQSGLPVSQANRSVQLTASGQSSVPPAVSLTDTPNQLLNPTIKPTNTTNATPAQVEVGSGAGAGAAQRNPVPEQPEPPRREPQGGTPPVKSRPAARSASKRVPPLPDTPRANALKLYGLGYIERELEAEERAGTETASLITSDSIMAEWLEIYDDPDVEKPEALLAARIREQVRGERDIRMTHSERERRRKRGAN